MYVKTFFVLRSFQNTTNYIINSIKKIEDYNEVTGHFLSIFLESEIRKKGYLIEEEKDVNKVSLITFLNKPFKRTR